MTRLARNEPVARLPKRHGVRASVVGRIEELKVADYLRFAPVPAALRYMRAGSAAVLDVLKSSPVAARLPGPSSGTGGTHPVPSSGPHVPGGRAEIHQVCPLAPLRTAMPLPMLLNLRFHKHANPGYCGGHHREAPPPLLAAVLQAVLAFQGAAHAGQLILNPGFENPAIPRSSWTAANGAVAVAGLNGSATAARLPYNTNASLTQNLASTTAGFTADISFQIAGSRRSPGAALDPAGRRRDGRRAAHGHRRRVAG